MTETETISWIFLAVALASKVEPADYNGISMIADGINHAVPTQKELQTSIKWLTLKGLIDKKGSKYSLSEKGEAMINRVSINSNTLLEQWANLEKELTEVQDDT